MIFLKPLELIIFLAFTLLFVCDYFPDNPLAYKTPKNVVIILFVGLFLTSFFIKRYRDTNRELALKWQLCSIAYILFLMGLLTVFGGQSASGISFDNGFLWIGFLISSIEIFSNWKKIKQSKTTNSEETHVK
ncbi:hypothetical protein LIT38_03785 [Bacillus sp. CMF12]|uniref:hypothetical protein n=1 Tax=Bacillaceae TaxID=186817 RepID=UPI001FB23115|nr:MULTISPECIES: hypothetical protein [Bacillaceae]UOE56119.1 hypothetical protein IRB79_04970 [Cytobacillus oceanisediminis]USK50599.1 hypothetical protein LIT38_03785 [Bacillus sp. CMF12]